RHSSDRSQTNLTITKNYSERAKSQPENGRKIRPESFFIDTNISGARISAVCISRYPEGLSIPGLPYHNYTEGWKPYGHEKTKERVSYLAERRNRAVAETLALLPETKHVMMIDSYYVPEDLHGCEHNWLCEHSGLPVFLSLSERMWRDPVIYPRGKRLRMSLHLSRLFRR